MEILMTADGIISLLTLTFLEIVLGIDNIIFITIAANKVAIEDQKKARRVGLALAMILRLVMLTGISLIYTLSEPWFHIDFLGLEGAVSGHALILALGGLFLIYKATSEIHHKLEGESEAEGKNAKGKSTLSQAIFQIALINVVFSFDSILTAVGLTDHIIIMVVSIILSIGVMMAFAAPVGNFVNKHPSIQMLGLSFLILIGFMLIAEGAHLAHLIEGSIPKGYLYFAIFFSLAVEFLNMKIRGSSAKTVALKQQAPEEGILKE